MRAIGGLAAGGIGREEHKEERHDQQHEAGDEHEGAEERE